MANEITFARLEATYSYDYRLMADALIDALYANSNVLQFLRQRSIADFASDSERFPVVPKLAASAIVDGADLTNTPFEPTQVTLTVGEVGVLLTLTDLARTSNIMDMAHYGAQAGRAVAEKLTADITALGAGFSNTVGTSGSNLSEANYRAAITQLAANDVPGPYASFLHPQQEEDLVGSIGSVITAAATSGDSARATTNDLGASFGTVGQLYNTFIVTNSTVPTANAGADRAGAMVAVGRALGYVEKWAIRPEMERDASLRGSEIVVTAAYAVGELDDISGVAIITDA